MVPLSVTMRDPQPLFQGPTLRLMQLMPY